MLANGELQTEEPELPVSTWDKECAEDPLEIEPLTTGDSKFTEKTRIKVRKVQVISDK